MATSSDLFIPSSPTNFTFRPMNKGMITSQTTVAMPDGSFLDLRGLDVTTKGLRRIGGWRAVDGNGHYLLDRMGLPNEERIEDMTQVALATGEKINVVFTNRFMYKFDLDLGFSLIPYARDYTIATVSVATNTTLTFTGDFQADYLEANDRVLVGATAYAGSLSGISSLLRKVLSVSVSPTTLTLIIEGTFPSTPVPGNKLNVFKPFRADEDRFVDFTHARNMLYMVDGNTPLVFKFGGGAFLQPHIITNDLGVRTVMGARTITYFGNRLYFGDVIEYDPSVSSFFFGQRVRWTEVLELNISKSANYQDLVRTTGKITKILGLGSLLVCYVTDGMYYGRATSLTSLPYAFTLIETGMVTAIGMKAVCSYFAGQAFVGQDNVYFVGADASVSPFGTPIAETLIDEINNPAFTYLKMDLENSRLIVAVNRETGNKITRFWFYNYRSKAWSRARVDLFAPSVLSLSDRLYYNELGPETYETSPYRFASYYSLMFQDTLAQLSGFNSRGWLLLYDRTAANDRVLDMSDVSTTTPIGVEIVTPDFDFDDPDVNKTALRLGFKISEPATSSRSEQIRYKTEVSIDRGRTWRLLGTLVIRPGYDEDALTFRVTGSTIRFRLTSGVVADTTDQFNVPYDISEITLRLRERSVETIDSNTRPTP